MRDDDFSPGETDLQLDNDTIYSCSAKELEGRPIYISIDYPKANVTVTETGDVFLELPETDDADMGAGEEASGATEDVFTYMKSMYGLTQPDMESGKITVAGRECYWIQFNVEPETEVSEEDDDVYGKYILFLPDKNDEAIEMSIVFKGPVDVEKSEKAIDQIIDSIRFTDSNQKDTDNSH